MTTINGAYTNALLADASYVGGLTPNTNLGTALSGRMTPAVADYISKNFSVVTQIESAGSSFDATVWRANNADGTPNPNGKIYVSMRGTQQATDFLVDADLAVTGNARVQIVDMVNWWFKITTSAGQAARQIALEPIYDNSTPPVQLNTRYVAAPDVMGTGLVSVSNLVSGIEVDGHSLGGYLATAFTRLFGAQAHVTHTSTFNSAGFAPGSETVFKELQNLIGPGYGLGRYPNASEQSNYFAVNGLNVTTNSFYFNQQGQRVELFQEEGLGVANHSMYRLTDLLAVGAALEKLDSNFTLDKLNTLSKVGSNDPKGSLESVLDGLRRALLAPNVERLPISDAKDSDPSRVTFQQTLATLQNAQIYKDLANQVLIRPAGSDLRANARNNFGAIVALQDLSPLYLTGKNAVAQALLDAAWQNSRSDDFTAWAADKSSSTPSTFTDRWITDRATMLGVLLERNKFDQTGVLTPNPSTGLVAGHYLDVSNSVDITVGLDTVSTQQILFGGDTADTLTGRSAEDHLYGGAGDDTLNGMAGNDYLEGGIGADTYQFIGTFGSDNVLDTDGQGSIKIGTQALTQPLTGGKRLTDNVWESDDKLYAYARSGADLVISTRTGGTASGSITVKAFTNGQLGITLRGDSTTPPTAVADSEITIYQSYKPAANNQGTQTVTTNGQTNSSSTGGDYDVQYTTNSAQSSFLYSGAQSQYLVGNAFDQLIITDTGNDLIVTSVWGDNPTRSDADTVNSGAGSDMIFTGLGRDIITAGAGDDFIMSAGLAMLASNQSEDPANQTPADANWVRAGMGSWGLYNDSQNGDLGGRLSTYGLSAHQYVRETGDSAIGDDIVDAGAGNDEQTNAANVVATNDHYTITTGRFDCKNSRIKADNRYNRWGLAHLDAKTTNARSMRHAKHKSLERRMDAAWGSSGLQTNAQKREVSQ